MKSAKPIREMTQDEKRAMWREYYHSNSKYREASRVRRNRRYREDDEYRERVKKSNLEYYYKRKNEAKR